MVNNKVARGIKTTPVLSQSGYFFLRLWHVTHNNNRLRSNYILIMLNLSFRKKNTSDVNASLWHYYDITTFRSSVEIIMNISKILLSLPLSRLFILYTYLYRYFCIMRVSDKIYYFSLNIRLLCVFKKTAKVVAKRSWFIILVVGRDMLMLYNLRRDKEMIKMMETAGVIWHVT